MELWQLAAPIKDKEHRMARIIYEKTRASDVREMGRGNKRNADLDE